MYLFCFSLPCCNNLLLRIVAETHYQLGVAQGFNAQYDEAVESLKNAINLIKSRIGNLQKAEDEETKKEVTDLKALIPEIEEKIKDTEVRFWFVSCWGSYYFYPRI